MNAAAAQRGGDPWPPPAHAVYREPGGVPTPPNLRPLSRAGAAPGKGLPLGARAARPCRGGRAWQAQAGSRRAWGAPPAMDSGPGAVADVPCGGAAGGVQTCAGATERCRGRIVPAESGIRQSFSPVLCRSDHAPSGDTRRRAADDRSSRPETCAETRGHRRMQLRRYGGQWAHGHATGEGRTDRCSVHSARLR